MVMSEVIIEPTNVFSYTQLIVSHLAFHSVSQDAANWRC